MVRRQWFHLLRRANQFYVRSIGGIFFVTLGAAFQVDGNNIWHAGNDGGGSGLDADLLDGQHGSYYWNAGNDGSGSTLDADLLDGQHGSYYQNANNINAGVLGTNYYSAIADLGVRRATWATAPATWRKTTLSCKPTSTPTCWMG